ncbi:MAG: 3-ketoacyl-ACP reductase [Pseudonocardia sp. SCN 72-86]|nr:MAG: 3-ketoacyl-ACP reductase [Pseudonocardia sp. SCN 72-86]
MGRVEGKVAVVTGAARGQGRSHAVRLAAEGADVIALDICQDIEGLQYPLATPEDLDETVREVEKLDRRVVARQVDVRDIEAMSAAVSDGVAELGSLDIVCANAGIVGPYGLDPADLVRRLTAFRLIVDVNLTGVFCTVEACRAALVGSGGGGSVIITSSLAGLRALGAPGGYTEAKHGLVGMMRAYAKEFAPHGIRVNTVHPTNVNTPMITNEATYRAFRPDLENPTLAEAEAALSYLNLLPVPYLEAGDISDAVLWLASEESRYVTGVALPVDAGGALK